MGNNNSKVREIPNFSSYAVNKAGRAWSKLKSKWLISVKNSLGYSVVTLCKDGNRFNKRVHRLVLETYVGPCPEGMEACHYNGVRTDNRLENLRWDTRSNNQLDAVRHGTHVNNRGEKNGKAKLTNEKVKVIRYLRRVGFTLKDIAWQFDVGIMTISRICARKNWNAEEEERLIKVSMGE